jgi:hypothetical protein
VLRPGHAEDESDAVPRQQRAGRPHEHALVAERDHDLEQRRRQHRHEDLGNREVEVEGDLTEHLERRDDCGEVQARVAQRR